MTNSNATTNPDLTLIAALLDRSGSMQTIVDDMRGGFDAFIATERAAGAGTDRATIVTLAQFDNEYELVYQNEPIESVPPLQLQPRGSTALLDAIGRFVADVGIELAARPDGQRPGSVTVLVLTDGHENASSEWTKAAVQQVIAQQEADYNWDFVFLGANIDAVDVGTGLGFAAGKSLTYDASGDGVAGAFASVSSYNRRKEMSPAPAAQTVFDDTDRRRARGGS